MFKRIFPLCLCLALLISGCANIKSLFQDDEVHYASLPPEALMYDGKTILEETKRLITSAEKAIFIEQKLFNHQELCNLILQKAKSGVEIRILLNQSAANRDIQEKFKSNNISAHFYPIQKGQTNNVKLMIVDYDQAIIYGAPWTPDDFNSHTLAVKITGKAARTATTVFTRDWRYTTTLDLEIPESNSLVDDYLILATNANVKQQILTRINSSKTSIDIEVAELSDSDILNALVDAKSKGLEIRVIIDAQTQRSNPTPKSLAKLTEAGIDVKFYQQDQPFARNIAIFDNTTFIFSSSGWTYNAFVMNHEFSITAPSPAATESLAQAFAEDWSKAATSID